MRHFTQVTDFSKQDYEELFRRAEIFESGSKAGKTFTHLAPGKVLGSLFFAESTRTSTGHKAGMIALGGGWVGVDGIKGTYLETAEEDIEDFILSYQDIVDILAIRHSDFNLVEFAPKLSVPAINGMCGTEEHSTGAAGMLYSIKKHAKKLEGLKIGVYGMISVSRPMKALYKILSMFGAHIIEDPLVDHFSSPNHVKKFVEKQGGVIEQKPFAEFLTEVDLLIVVEGLPQKGADAQKVNEFNSKFKTITNDTLKPLRDDALLYVVGPRSTTDGRLTVAKEVDPDPRNILHHMLSEWKYVIMGIITICMEIEVS